jgi:NAD(P)-dependent dehydrogenase (short-subunit alcohol dehydrogenase family)
MVVLLLGLRRATTVWQRVIDVNLRGIYLACRTFGLHALPRRAGGAIVNIGSVAGLSGIPGSNRSGSSNAAVTRLTWNLACEWAMTGIRVSCVAPRYIEAPMTIEMLSNVHVDRSRIEQRLPMQR